jgi:EPS-associated MarR family transcriptional regulator
MTFRTQLKEDTTYRVLRVLQANPDLTQREIAQQLSMSTSGLNYCLKALIAKGLVRVGNFSQSKNKFGYIYVLTPRAWLPRQPSRAGFCSASWPNTKPCRPK